MMNDDMEVVREKRQQHRCGYCNDVGHNNRTCAMRVRVDEERAIGMPVPRVHDDNKEEFARVRALTETRLREEAAQARAQALQESENRAQERAQARVQREAERVQREAERVQREVERVRAQAERVNVEALQLQNQEGEELRRIRRREAADQRLEAALEGVAHFDGALQRREVFLARQERDRIAWREREARLAPPELVREVRDMPDLGREVRVFERIDPPQLPPNMDEIPLADRWRVWRDYENHGAPRNMVTENELARMVALPVLRETAVEATECPICIEDLGEVGKTVLKCGHTVCVSCFLQQMMRATAESRAHDCKCPECRVSYIM